MKKSINKNSSQPKHAGWIEDANGVGQVGSPSCGDIVKFYLKINDEEVIENASFKTLGSGETITSNNMATAMIIGKSIEEAGKLKNSDVAEALGGLPNVKISCSVLAAEAIKAAIRDYNLKKHQADKKQSMQ